MGTPSVTSCQPLTCLIIPTYNQHNPVFPKERLVQTLIGGQGGVMTFENKMQVSDGRLKRGQTLQCSHRLISASRALPLTVN